MFLIQFSIYYLVWKIAWGLMVQLQEKSWEIAQEKQKMPVVAVELAANDISWISFVIYRK